MRKVIEGKVYSTSSAELICHYWNGRHLGYGDFNAESVDLYKIKQGAFFIHGEGGACTQWGKKVGNNGAIAGEDIRLLTEGEAKAWLEEHGDANQFEDVFGEAVEG